MPQQNGGVSDGGTSNDGPNQGYDELKVDKPLNGAPLPGGVSQQLGSLPDTVENLDGLKAGAGTGNALSPEIHVRGSIHVHS